MKKWKLPAPEVDIRSFRFSKLNQKEYRHFYLLLFWPVYYLRYFIVEAINPASAACHVMYSPLDDLIPVCEFFLIPYALWMVCMLGMHFFTAIYDVDTFKKYSKYMIIAFTVSTLTFLVYPTCQNLRPETFERDNFFTKILAFVYAVDTSTNVCPSEHVIGSMAILAAAINCRYFRTPGRITLVTVLMIVISLSTVFLKQHSVLDIFWAMPLCLVTYLICFGIKKKPADSQAPIPSRRLSADS